MKMTEENEERMRLLYKKMQSSGLSRKRFCKIENLAYSTFGYWVKKFDKSKRVFKEIKVVKTESASCIPSTAEFVLEFPSGAKLTFNHLADPTWIKSIV